MVLPSSGGPGGVRLHVCKVAFLSSGSGIMGSQETRQGCERAGKGMFSMSDGDQAKGRQQSSEIMERGLRIGIY